MPSSVSPSPIPTQNPFTQTLNPLDQDQANQFAKDLWQTVYQHKHPFTLVQDIFLILNAIIPGPPDKKLYIYLAILNFLSNLPHLLPYIALAALFVCAGVLAAKFLLLKLASKQDAVLLEVTFPHRTLQSAYSTEELFTQLHSIGASKGLIDKIFKKKSTFGLEIVSTKDTGVRYLISVSADDKKLIESKLYAFLPSVKIKQVKGYLPNKLDPKNKFKVLNFKLFRHFAFPLKNQKTLEEHDPIAYITGAMTNLAKDELISLQLIVTPLDHLTHFFKSREALNMSNTILNGGDVFSHIDKHSKPLWLRFIFWVLLLIVRINILVLWITFVIPLWVVAVAICMVTSDGKNMGPSFIKPPLFGQKRVGKLNEYQKEVEKEISDKLDKELFEVSVRAMIVANDLKELSTRERDLVSSISAFTNQGWQSLRRARSIFSKIPLYNRLLYSLFQKRAIPAFESSPILSVSELADIYHLPYTDTTKTEGLIKSKSADLPAPVSMKRSSTNIDVIVGKNEYGRETTPIGLTLEQRERHTYLIGKTGMGKTEMLKNMIYQDMKNGKGLAVLDPHGDLFHELLRIVPKSRRKDVIVFNPADRDWPVGLNILSSGIVFEDIEDGRDKTVSTTLAVFQKITDEKYWGPRLEHILRNATQTTLFTTTPSFWIVQKLLTSGRDYQKQVANTLEDPVLKQFWEGEFALLGKMQQSDTTSPITNRIGKFITSSMSRNILLQPKSTFNIQRIMDEGKILLVNLSKGELGEDQSHFFGSLIISLIQLAAYERIHIPESKRRNFFLYVDEFQNFATHIFEELSSEGRKWHVPLIPSHQNIAQIKDPNLLKIVAGNADTIIAMKAGPDDEKFILPFMEPEVEKGGIVNLPPYRFYMKVTNADSEDAFSGVTELLDVKGSDEVAKEVIEYSRKNYSTPRKEVEAYLKKLFGGESETKVKTVKPGGQKPGKGSRKNSGKKGVKKKKEPYV